MDEQETELRKEYIAALNEWVRLDSEWKAMLPEVFGASGRPKPFIPTPESLEAIATAEERRDAAFKHY